MDDSIYSDLLFSKLYVQTDLYKPARTDVLHYAPDNASIINHLVPLEPVVPFKTRLVDRSIRQQSSQSFLKLNPNGRIPVLETENDTLLKTGAILLRLADQHGALATKMGQLERDPFLTWLSSLSNTMHPTLLMLFFPETYLAQPTEETLQDLRKRDHWRIC